MNLRKLIIQLVLGTVAIPILSGCSGLSSHSAKPGCKIVEFMGSDGFEVPVSWTSSPGESNGHSVDIVIAAPNNGKIEAHTVEQLELKDYLSMQHLSEASPTAKSEVEIDGVNFNKETTKGKDESGADAVMTVYSRSKPSGNHISLVFVCQARNNSELSILEKCAESYKF